MIISIVVVISIVVAMWCLVWNAFLTTIEIIISIVVVISIVVATGVHLFEQTGIPFCQGCFVPGLVEIGQVVLEKMKIWTVYDNDNDDDDNGQIWSEKLSWAFG